MKKAEPSRTHAVTGSRGHRIMVPINKLQARVQAGYGGLMAEQNEANKLFREDGRQPFDELPRKAETLEDVTRGLGLEPGTDQQIQKLVGETNAHFDQTTQTQRIFLARRHLVESLRSFGFVDSDQRLEITKRATAYWKFTTQTDYGKKPTVRYSVRKSEATLVIEKSNYTKPTKYESKKPDGKGGWTYKYNKHGELGEKSLAVLRKLVSHKLVDPAAMDPAQRSGLNKLVERGWVTVGDNGVNLTAEGLAGAKARHHRPKIKRGKGKFPKVTKKEAVVAFGQTPHGSRVLKVDRYSTVVGIVDDALRLLEAENGQAAVEKLKLLGLSHNETSGMLLQLDKKAEKARLDKVAEPKSPTEAAGKDTATLAKKHGIEGVVRARIHEVGVYVDFRVQVGSYTGRSDEGYGPALASLDERLAQVARTRKKRLTKPQKNELLSYFDPKTYEGHYSAHSQGWMGTKNALFDHGFLDYGEGGIVVTPKGREQAQKFADKGQGKLKKSADNEPTLVSPIERFTLRKAGAPPGYSPIPNGKKGGFRKRVGGKWVRWYPKAAVGRERKAAPKEDRLVAPNNYQGPIQPGHDLYQAEDAIRSNQFEHSVVFDAEGEQLWRQTDGKPDSIYFDEAVVTGLRDNGSAVFTHNHPNGTSLSADDIVCAVHTNLAEVRAVGPTGRVFRLKRPAGGWVPDSFKEDLINPDDAAQVEPWFLSDVTSALRQGETGAAEAARGAMDRYLRTVDDSFPVGPTHPAYSEDKWYEINAQIQKGIFNKILEKHRLEIEELPPGHREERPAEGRGLPDRRQRARVPAKPQEKGQLGFDFDKAFRFIVPLQKAGATGGKYIKRVPYMKDGKRRYRYYYSLSAVARDAVAGEQVKLGKTVAEILGIADDGTITVQIGTKTHRVSPDGWQRILTRHYGDKLLGWREKRATQTVNAVLRYVPRELLEDLKGTDAERLAQLEKRVPEVYAKLQKSFQRSGVSPFRAKAILGEVLDRRGWEPEARAAIIGHVIQRRGKGYRQIIRGAENLAGGDKVKAAHVQSVGDFLRPPNGKSAKDNIDLIAKKAEREMAQLSSALSAAHSGTPHEAAQALVAALGTDAMRALMEAAQAMPGLKHKAVEPVRKKLLEVPSVAPRTTPTREGAESVVYVSGEGGQPRALKARYKLVEAAEAVASHNPNTFSKRDDYPEGVQERAYHRDRDEQAKVLRNAQKLNPAFLINTNPDAVNGPPILDQNGVVLGGNSRTMSMQLAYEKHPEKAAEMKAYLAKHAQEVGFKAGDVTAMKNPILVREVVSEGVAEQKLLVRQMNESFTQGMDPRTMQVAMGRKLDDGALKELGDSMQADESLGAFLDSKRAEGFINALTRVGIIDQRNSNQYMVKGTKRLNEDGKQLVERVLVGRTVGDADLLSNTGSRLIGNIARAVPFMAQAKSYGAGYDLGDDLKVALEAYNDLNYRAQQGQRAALSADMSETEFKGLFAQDEMFGEQNPIVANDRAMTMLEVLIRKNGPQKMSAVFKDYAARAAQHPEDQEAMFGDAPSPAALFAQVAKGETVQKSMTTLVVKGGTKYKRRWRGPDGQYQYEYADPIHSRSREDFLGKPTRTKASNASDLVAKHNKLTQDTPAEGWDAAPSGDYKIHRGHSEDGKRATYVVTHKGEPIAKYDGEILVVSKKHRRKGIAANLVADFRTENPHVAVAGERTKNAQKVQEAAWKLIQERKVKKSMEPTLIVKARGSTFVTHVPVSPQSGSAPRFHTPPIPDFQEIYMQPESTEKQKLEEEQRRTRQRAQAERNRGKYAFHGTPLPLKPILRWGEEDSATASYAVHDPDQPGKRKPRKSPKLAAERRGKAGKQTYEDAGPDLDGKGKKRKRKKKKKKAKLVARIQ